MSASAAPVAPRVAALVLATGSSERMGAANKLLETLDGQTLVARAVDAALRSRARPVVVVTGHEAERVESALAGRAVALARNPDHASGLASSLRAGLAALGDFVEGALVCLGDMPWVRSADLDRLLDAFASRAERPICVPVHAGRRGNPVLWPARHFAELRSLEGDVGGRVLLRRYAARIHAVAMPEPGVRLDVDRPGDLGR